MLCCFWPHTTTTYANINSSELSRMGLGGLSLPTLKSFDHWRVMISCLSQRETFMRDLFIKTHEHQIYTICTTTMMMDMALILFKWSRWMMTFISLVKCCSNIIQHHPKGPRKVSSFTAGFFPFWNSWDYYVFLQGIIIDVLILRSSFYAHDAEVLDFDWSSSLRNIQ